MLLLARTVLVMIAGFATVGDSQTLCSNATWTHRDSFYTFWHDTGSGCMQYSADASYSVTWKLGDSGNLVAGKGWKTGSLNRIVHYKAEIFEPGTNGYLSLYGWSTNPLIEYYVVENWGNFTPPGRDAVFLGTLTSDHGTYRVYKARRIDQPSIAGTATFDQYWSVRTTRRPVGTRRTITFGNHVLGWRKLGLPLGTLDYQVIATEGFGSTGRSKIDVAGR